MVSSQEPSVAMQRLVTCEAWQCVAERCSATEQARSAWPFWGCGPCGTSCTLDKDGNATCA